MHTGEIPTAGQERLLATVERLLTIQALEHLISNASPAYPRAHRPSFRSARTATVIVCGHGSASRMRGQAFQRPCHS